MRDTRIAADDWEAMPEGLRDLFTVNSNRSEIVESVRVMLANANRLKAQALKINALLNQLRESSIARIADGTNTLTIEETEAQRVAIEASLDALASSMSSNLQEGRQVYSGLIAFGDSLGVL